MRKIRLFIDKQKNYFLVDKHNIFCDKCKIELENIFFMIINWSKKKSSLNITCNNCLVKIQKTGEVYEAKYGTVARSVESDFTPVFIQTPNLMTSKNKETVFCACDLPSDQTIDKAWRSREYPGLEGAFVGKSIKEITSKDKALSTSGGLVLLDDLTNPKNPLLNSDKKMLKNSKR